jgi:hypothetical protein
VDAGRRSKTISEYIERGSEEMNAKEFLDKAATHMQDRASTYDKPQGERSMTTTVGAFNAINGTRMTEEQGWMFMELLKIVRSMQGEYKADNYEDAVAYAALRGECASAHRGEPLLNQMIIGTAGDRMRSGYTGPLKHGVCGHCNQPFDFPVGIRTYEHFCPAVNAVIEVHPND